MSPTSSSGASLRTRKSEGREPAPKFRLIVRRARNRFRHRSRRFLGTGRHLRQDDTGRQQSGTQVYPSDPDGAIAQLGERLNGIQEVGGSIPPGSTNRIKGLDEIRKMATMA